MKRLLSLLPALLAGSISLFAGTAEKGHFTLAAGEKSAFPCNFVRFNTTLQADFNFGSFQPVRLGRGTETLYRSAWVEVTEKEAIFYDVLLENKTLEEDFVSDDGKKSKKTRTVRARVPKEIKRLPHELNMKEVRSMSVLFNTGHEITDFVIRTDKGSFTTTLKGWFAGGEPFIRNIGTDPFEVDLLFDRRDAVQPIWFFGASYFNTISSSRWAYYMRKEGYTNFMGDHLPGGTTTNMLACFKEDLRFGTPKIAVWMLMANNKGDSDVIDPVWLKDTEEFISICKIKGIEPILNIYPPVHGKDFSKKIAWIKASGFRYIDFRDACCDESGHWKDQSLLSKDGVHPSPAGAEIMWQAVKKVLKDELK